MAWLFGDGFDFYSTQNDMVSGSNPLWVSAAALTFTTGRFSGSQAILTNAGGGGKLTQSTSSNNATVYINFAYFSNTALSGSSLQDYIQFLDGSTVQCTLYFRSDGALLFYNGDSTGTLLATFTSAFSALTWIHFQISVTINSTTGSIHIRKNGNIADDFASTGLNTQKSANAYVNAYTFFIAFSTVSRWDDLYVFSSTGAAPNTWQGDVRSQQLMVASDPGSPKFSKFPNTGTLFSKINEAQEDGDTTYIFDNVVNDEDDFVITAMTTNPIAIIATQVKAFVKKTSTGPRSGDIILKSSSASANFGSTNLSSTYGYLNLLLTTDPNTSAAWTQTNLNAITIGPKVTA